MRKAVEFVPDLDMNDTVKMNLTDDYNFIATHHYNNNNNTISAILTFFEKEDQDGTDSEDGDYYDNNEVNIDEVD